MDKRTVLGIIPKRQTRTETNSHLDMFLYKTEKVNNFFHLTTQFITPGDNFIHVLVLSEYEFKNLIINYN